MRAVAGAAVGASGSARVTLLLGSAPPDVVVVSARVLWHHLATASVANTRMFPLRHVVTSSALRVGESSSLVLVN